MLIGSITRTTVACLCSCGKLRARNYERLHPPPSPPTFLSTYRPPDEIEFQPFLTFWPLAPPASGGGLIYIYWSIKSANHELLGQPHYLNKKKLFPSFCTELNTFQIPQHLQHLSVIQYKLTFTYRSSFCCCFYIVWMDMCSDISILRKSLGEP